MMEGQKGQHHRQSLTLESESECESRTPSDSNADRRERETHTEGENGLMRRTMGGPVDDWAKEALRLKSFGVALGHFSH